MFNQFPIYVPLTHHTLFNFVSLVAHSYSIHVQHMFNNWQSRFNYCLVCCVIDSKLSKRNSLISNTLSIQFQMILNKCSIHVQHICFMMLHSLFTHVQYMFHALSFHSQLMLHICSTHFPQTFHSLSIYVPFMCHTFPLIFDQCSIHFSHTPAHIHREWGSPPLVTLTIARGGGRPRNISKLMFAYVCSALGARC